MDLSSTLMNASPPPPTKTTSSLQQRAPLLGGIAFASLVTGLIWLLGPRLDAIALLPDAGPSWYFWKLPEPTLLSRAVVWGLYVAHQVSLWALIWWAQVKRPNYAAGVGRINVIALAVNAFFVLAHVAQTHLTYDGLAQDVSIWSSQGAVIVMLVWILLLENPRRGLVFGVKLPMGAAFKQFVRRYHGYFFAWAIVYTFWYHPAVATEGHLWGFFYTILLLVQSSLFFTRAHLNRYWTFALEATVLVHGALVAVGQGGGLWPMFAFGFGGLIVLTQMHGLGLSRLVRGVIVGLYAGLVAIVYADRGFGRIDEIFRIPLIEVLAVLVLAGLFAGAFAMARRLTGTLRSESMEAKVRDPMSASVQPRVATLAGVLVIHVVAYAPMIIVFSRSDAPIVAFLTLAVSAPILAVVSWRLARRESIAAA